MELLILFMINHVEHVVTGSFMGLFNAESLSTQREINNSILQLQLVTRTKSPIPLYNYGGRNKLRPSRENLCVLCDSALKNC